MSLLGKKLLGSTFVADQDTNWIKIDGIALGNSSQYSYKNGKTDNIGTLLNQQILDPKVVAVLWNKTNSSYYIRSGFNINNPGDYASNEVFISYVVKLRIPWSIGVSYAVGDGVSYNGSNYKCRIPNLSQSDWSPTEAIDLWEVVNSTSTSTTTQPTTTQPTTSTPTTTQPTTSTPTTTQPTTSTPTTTQPTTSTPTTTQPTTSTPAITTPSKTVTTKFPTTSTPGSGLVVNAYVDVGLWPTIDLVSAAQESGINSFTLAFIVAGGEDGDECAIAGAQPLVGSSTFFLDQATEITNQGGQIILSFGGSSGEELAEVITDVNALVTQYQDAINVFTPKYIDFDIEGADVIHSVTDLRNQALKIIQKNNPGIQISYTLPVLQTGLTADGLYVLTSAKEYGFTFDRLNIMTMDYGASGVEMGQACIEAANATYDQLKTVGFTETSIGLINMIGQNDATGEIFTHADATTVTTFAKETPWITLLSFWSIGRDTAELSINANASPSESGVVQDVYAYSKLFLS
jgi:hypothetical protein